MTALDAATGAVLWRYPARDVTAVRADAEETAPTQWGLSGSVPAAADVGLDAVDLATGASPGTPTERPAPPWFTVASGVLVFVGAELST